jgi:YidC/Oxa1 family membrane protein insertase
MEDQNKNLILATALSALVILVWMVFFPPPEVVPVTPTETTQPATAAVPDTATPTTSADTTAIATAARVQIETPHLTGSISTLGGRIDDLKLSQYRETLQPGSDTVRLLTPVGQDSAYYALFGWAPGPGLAATDVPDARQPFHVLGH